MAEEESAQMADTIKVAAGKYSYYYFAPFGRASLRRDVIIARHWFFLRCYCTSSTVTGQRESSTIS